MPLEELRKSGVGLACHNGSVGSHAKGGHSNMLKLTGGKGGRVDLDPFLRLSNFKAAARIVSVFNCGIFVSFFTATIELLEVGTKFFFVDGMIEKVISLEL